MHIAALARQRGHSSKLQHIGKSVTLCDMHSGECVLCGLVCRQAISSCRCGPTTNANALATVLFHVTHSSRVWNMVKDCIAGLLNGEEGKYAVYILGLSGSNQQAADLVPPQIQQ